MSGKNKKAKKEDICSDKPLQVTIDDPNCCVCFEFPLDPYSCKNNGHIICLACMKQLQNKTCPICRSRDFTENPLLKRLLMQTFPEYKEKQSLRDLLNHGNFKKFLDYLNQNCPDYKMDGPLELHRIYKGIIRLLLFNFDLIKAQTEPGYRRISIIEIPSSSTECTISFGASLYLKFCIKNRTFYFICPAVKTVHRQDSDRDSDDEDNDSDEEYYSSD